MQPMIEKNLKHKKIMFPLKLKTQEGGRGLYIFFSFLRMTASFNFSVQSSDKNEKKNVTKYVLVF